MIMLYKYEIIDELMSCQINVKESKWKINFSHTHRSKSSYNRKFESYILVSLATSSLRFNK